MYPTAVAGTREHALRAQAVAHPESRDHQHSQRHGPSRQGRCRGEEQGDDGYSGEPPDRGAGEACGDQIPAESEEDRRDRVFLKMYALNIAASSTTHMPRPPARMAAARPNSPVSERVAHHRAATPPT